MQRLNLFAGLAKEEVEAMALVDPVILKLNGAVFAVAHLM